MRQFRRAHPAPWIAVAVLAVTAHGLALYGFAHLAIPATVLGVGLFVVIAKHAGVGAALLAPVRRWLRRR